MGDTESESVEVEVACQIVRVTKELNIDLFFNRFVATVGVENTVCCHLVLYRNE